MLLKECFTIKKSVTQVRSKNSQKCLSQIGKTLTRIGSCYLTANKSDILRGKTFLSVDQ
jgi:hypothetical protein